MAKAEKLLEGLQAQLEAGERVEVYVQGAYVKNKMTRNGLFAATDRRLVFFGKKFGGFDFESFPYRNISSFEQSRGFNGHTMVFFASGNKVEMKWIADGESLAEIARRVQGASEPAVGPVGPAGVSSAGSDAAEALDALERLGRLRESGVVTVEEFEAKKAELLKRIR